MSAIRHIVTVGLCLFALAACEEDTQVPERDSIFPDVMQSQREACERKGGNWASTPSRSGFICFQQTSDANQMCRASSECEGVCLARSRTCAPVVPLLGCHEVLTASGLRQTICVDG